MSRIYGYGFKNEIIDGLIIVRLELNDFYDLMVLHRNSIN